MAKSESELVKYIERLLDESKMIAPSISRYDEDGKYGRVTDEHLNHIEYIRWDIEVHTLLKDLADIYKSNPYQELYSKYKNQKNEKVHSKSIYVQRSKQLIMAALHFIKSNMSISSNTKNDILNIIGKNSDIDIFISHSSRDKDIAERIIDILNTSLNLQNVQIRCTSVDGYRLPGGAKTDEILRIEVYNTKVLVGIITKHSLTSPFVLFELGARWGSGRLMIPLLAKGIKPDQLKGPLENINCLSCESTAQIQQFIDEIANELKANKQSAASYHNKIEKLVQYSNQLKSENSNIDSSTNEVIFEDGVYWIQKNGSKDGPFCQVCKDKDNKLIRLVFDEVDIGESKPLQTKFCRVCGNHQ